MEREIFNKDFSTQNEAIKKMASFDYGTKKISEFNLNSFVIILDKEEERNLEFDLYFKSENEDGFYFYVIENHNSVFKLVITRTNKNKMITGAIEGDLEMLIDNFANNNKMKGFALERAIENGNWNIVEYIIDKYDITENPLWYSIRYNNVNILIKLIRRGIELPKDWLAYCMRNDSIDVTKRLLQVEKAHQKFQKSELRTNWFHREIQKDKETSIFVRDFFDMDSLDDILKKIKL